MESFRPFPGVIRRQGRGKCGGQIFLTDDQVAWMREGSKILKRSELAAMMGISVSSFGHLKARLGLKGINPDRPGYARARYFAEHPDAKKKMYEKMAATRRKTIRRERFNIAMGLHQETRLHLVEHPMTSAEGSRRYRLKQAGYIVPNVRKIENYPYRRIFYYDDDTHRLPRTEARMKAEGFTFLPIVKRRRNGGGAMDDRSLAEWML